ncbi:pyroglutamyl-peptidase I [Collimonas sp. OK412]|jgi:pyroglutamyl-peptidase|uniref:pyroglutamyl-peptidase I n=1 Tax=Collimonas sp. (strain OK412) TaxID=1801619 RepID=UPI0008E07599|nr:pyroglutamyl-peptidase I [Collimonas sp. OK412]SFC20423.1 pyroglutamyl-peptidase I . Cysteine peptidase. MEROPS family C15 [Collimonas sp. OK412]
MTRHTILLTGFEPFEQEPLNPSWEAVRALDGWPCAGAQVAARQLPCVFGQALQVLGQLMEELKPALVICVGQAGGRSQMSLERVAINVDDARIADNAGRQPIDQPIRSGGPAAYFSTLPIKGMAKAMRAAGIPAEVSQTAGTFVCNHVFYGLMDQLAAHAPAVRGGFIHIPYIPSQAARHPGQPSLALETLVEGLRIALQSAMTLQQDVEEGGGQLH